MIIIAKQIDIKLRLILKQAQNFDLFDSLKIVNTQIHKELHQL